MTELTKTNEERIEVDDEIATAIANSEAEPNSGGGVTREIGLTAMNGVTYRLRVQVTQNTKGYQFERAAEVQGEISPAAAAMETYALLTHGARIARLDIANCRADDLKVAS